MPRSLLVPSTSVPSTRTLPLVGFMSPAIHLRSVLLPQPEGPRNTTTSPVPGLSAIEKDTSFTACTGSPARLMYVTDTSSTESLGVGPGPICGTAVIALSSGTPPR